MNGDGDGDAPEQPRRGPHGDFRPRIFLADGVKRKLLKEIHPSRRAAAAELLDAGLTEDFDALRRAYPAPADGTDDDRG